MEYYLFKSDTFQKDAIDLVASFPVDDFALGEYNYEKIGTDPMQLKVKKESSFDHDVCCIPGSLVISDRFKAVLTELGVDYVF